MILNTMGYILITFGTFLIISTTIGFVRFGNLYTQIHISSITDMLGFPFVIFGVAMLFYSNGDMKSTLKLLFATILWYIFTPITSYIMIKIAYFYNKKIHKS